MTHPSRRSQDEQGFALITVMLVIMIVTLLISGSLAYSLGSLAISRHDQDWNAALSAAEGGVDDYVFRLNQNTNYWQYSAAVAPPDGNLAFNFTAGPPALPVFVALPGSTNDAKFHYSADTTTLATDGLIKVTATGSVRKTTRSVRVVVRQRSFLDYIYFTDYETVDPARYSNPPMALNAAQAGPPGNLCDQYYPNRDSNCSDIVFFGGDTINGPLHSNDALQMTGTPTFNGTVSTAWTGESCTAGTDACVAGTRLWHDAGGGAPVFSANPTTGAPLVMPPSNSTLKAYADPTIPSGVGCLFTGPTNIVLNAAGTMTVTSPDTVTSNCNATGANPKLGTGATVTMPLPTNGVVFVQSVPTAPDPNADATPCTNVHPLGYPKKAGDVTPYGCADGDAFVSGTLNGQLTIASDHNITIIGNLTYQGGLGGGSKDVLGLVATSYINVYHPVDSNGNNLTGANGTLTNPVIDAAMVTLKHSFLVPNWAGGNPLGTLTVNGAIAQEYRGPVGTGYLNGTIVSGYSKNYVYDQRLKYLSPPHFIDPVASAWQIKLWSEIKPAYAGP